MFSAPFPAGFNHTKGSKYLPLRGVVRRCILAPGGDLAIIISTNHFTGSPHPRDVELL
jgi:hypothetical protein